MRVIIAGGRNFDDYKLLEDKCNDLLIPYQDNLQIVYGGAKGADTLGKKWADTENANKNKFLFGNKKICVKPYLADWKDLSHPDAVIKENQYGKYDAKAGHRRNEKMANNADMLIAFWDGESKGTKNMIYLALKYGLEVHVYRY